MPTTQYNQGNRRDNFNKLDQVCWSLQKLTERLDLMEGRASSNNWHRAPPQAGNRGRRYTQSVQEAANDKSDFGKLYRALCRFVQLNHHIGNWERLPRSLQTQLDGLIDYIRPPGTDDDLLGELMFLGCNFGASLSATVRAFLQHKIDETARELRQLSRSELARAKQLSDLFIADKLPRLGRAKRQQLINEGAEVVGADHERVNFLPPLPPPPAAAASSLSNPPALPAPVQPIAAASSSKVATETTTPGAAKRFKPSYSTPIASSTESSIQVDSSDEEEEQQSFEGLTELAYRWKDDYVCSEFRHDIIEIQVKHSNKPQKSLEKVCDEFLLEQCKELGTQRPTKVQWKQIVQVIITANKGLPLVKDLEEILTKWDWN
jgi:hypothetical protein